MEYTDRFRSKMVRKMLGPSGVTATALAAKVGVPQPTLSRWLREAATLGAMSTEHDDDAPAPPATPAKPRQWTPEEKLRVIGAAHGLEGEALGALLRREGVHLAELEEWRRAAQQALGAPGGTGRAKVARGEARRVRELERELRRKDKALAEVTALLVLKKKAAAIWGTEGEDEDDSTDEKNEK